ncbi:hypothetical protein ACH4E8_34845 [Streptomyces sp. NPDC017979]
MEEVVQEYGSPFRHIPPWVPPLLLAGVDDETDPGPEPEEQHIVRGID